MLKIIPTPIFMDVDKNKALKIKSLSLDESKINQAVVDDFYDFLDKLKIKVGDDCTDVVGFAFFIVLSMSGSKFIMPCEVLSNVDNLIIRLWLICSF